MGFNKFGVFLLLLSAQLHLFLALPKTSLPNPFMTLDFNQEQNVTHKSTVPKGLSMPVKLGDNQNITAVNRRGGGAGGRGRGGGGGGIGGARGRGDVGGKKSPYKQQGGVVTPLYVGGAMNHPRVSNSRGSNSGTLHCISLDYLILAFFTYLFLLYF